MKKHILPFFIITIFSAFSIAAESQSSDLLLKMARSEWNDVQLQTHGLIDSDLDKETIENKVKQAVIWLEAANRLSPGNEEVLGDMEYLYRSEMIDDPGRAMDALIKYSELNPKDNLCVDGWLKYRLGELNKLNDRDYFIESMQQSLEEYPMVLSDMLTLRGIFALEQGDFDKAASFYESAWRLWAYNTDAAARLLSLPLPQINSEDESITEEQKVQWQAEVEQNHITRTVYYHIMSLTNNPVNLDDAISLADMLYSLNKYEKAAILYQHGIKLLQSAGTDEATELLNGFYFKAGICLFNSGEYLKTLDVLSNIKMSDTIDLPSTAFEIMALKKTDKKDDAELLIAKIDKYAENISSGKIEVENIDQVNFDLAWLYCFAVEDFGKAIKFANEIKPDKDGNLSSLLAYIQVRSGSIYEANVTLKKCVAGSPLTEFASALISLNNSQTEEASESLINTITSSPGVLYTFAMAKLEEINQSAKQQLSQPDIIDSINSQISEELLNKAFTPEKYIQFSINPHQNIYDYNETIYADISVTNTSQLNQAFGAGSLIDPYVYIYAEVLPKVNAKSIKPKVIPLSVKYLAQNPELKPGFSNTVKGIINIGKLDEILQLYPQLAYKIKLNCVPMPVVSDGKISSSLLEPSNVIIERKAFKPTPQRLSSYFDMLRTGNADERIEAGILFAGILKENQLAAQGKLFYQSTKLDYARTLKAILANTSHENPLIRAWTIYALDGLLKDKNVLNVITSKLEDSDWFVRLAALNVLKKSVNISSVIDWFNENETDETILRQIKLWKQQKWETIDVPFELPEEKDEN